MSSSYIFSLYIILFEALDVAVGGGGIYNCITSGVPYLVPHSIAHII